MSSTTDECPICITKYTKSTRKRIECAYCPFEACTTCIQRYILESAQDPTCMSCKNVWGDDFINNNFTKSFVTQKLRKNHQNQLFLREVALFPATQPFVETYLRIKVLKQNREDMEAEIDKIRQLQYHFEDELAVLTKQRDPSKIQRMADCQMLIEKYAKDIDNTWSKIREEDLELTRLQYALRRRTINNESASPQKFIRKCPHKDCKGFLAEDYTCSLCKNKTCSQCMEVLSSESSDTPHVCSPEVVATVKLIMADTKPCPQCGEMIHKSMGCSQMFSTCCKIVWDWITGEIIKSGPMHNPHYIEYMMQNRRDEDGVEDHEACVPLEFPSYRTVKTHLTAYRLSPYDVDGFKANIVHYMWWVQDLYDYYRDTYYVDELEDNCDIRITFMANDMTETEFKALLYKREKAKNKKREFSQVISMIYDVSIDIINSLLRENTRAGIISKIDEIEKLVEYTRQSILKLKTKYSCSAPPIDVKTALRPDKSPIRF